MRQDISKVSIIILIYDVTKTYAILSVFDDLIPLADIKIKFYEFLTLGMGKLGYLLNNL
jgi:hypothetical protein